MDENLATPEEERNKEADRSKYEFKFGLVVGLVINIIAFLILFCNLTAYFGSNLSKIDIPWGFGAAWLGVNLVAILYFALTSRKLFNQMLKGLGLAFLLVIVVGSITTAMCWSS